MYNVSETDTNSKEKPFPLIHFWNAKAGTFFNSQTILCKVPICGQLETTTAKKKKLYNKKKHYNKNIKKLKEF